jgi:hypothetical protein
MEMSENRKLEKPAAVKFSIFLMYAVVAVGFLRTGMTIGRHLDVRTPYMYLGTKTLVYALSVFLIYQISKGKNWARWTLLVILAVAVPLGVLPTLDSIEHSPLHAQLGFGQLAAFILAVVLLLMPQSSRWLKSTKSSQDKVELQE